MKSSQPPTLATWLLKHLGSGPTDESLLGDLLEEYEHGRSRAWYWRQAVMAILTGAYQDIRANKLLACRALVTGWAVSWVFFRIVFFPLADFGEWLFVRGIADIRWWWPKGPIPYFAVGSILGACNGWIVARFHRPSMLLMFVVSVMLWNFGWLPVVVSQYVSSAHYGSEWLFRTFLIQAMLVLVVMPISILFGGLLAPARRGSAPVDERVAT